MTATTVDPPLQAGSTHLERDEVRSCSIALSAQPISGNSRHNSCRQRLTRHLGQGHPCLGDSHMDVFLVNRK